MVDHQVWRKRCGGGLAVRNNYQRVPLPLLLFCQNKQTRTRHFKVKTNTQTRQIAKDNLNVLSVESTVQFHSRATDRDERPARLPVRIDRQRRQGCRKPLIGRWCNSFITSHFNISRAAWSRQKAFLLDFTSQLQENSPQFQAARNKRRSM